MAPTSPSAGTTWKSPHGLPLPLVPRRPPPLVLRLPLPLAQAPRGSHLQKFCRQRVSQRLAEDRSDLEPLHGRGLGAGERRGRRQWWGQTAGRTRREQQERDGKWWEGKSQRQLMAFDPRRNGCSRHSKQLPCEPGISPTQDIPGD